jgi:predicted DNA-binding transcriptional regulator AlpA
MREEFERRIFKMKAVSQGLQYTPKTPYEIVATDDHIGIRFDRGITIRPDLVAWAEENCQDALRLRYDLTKEIAYLVFGDAQDMTMFNLRFI